MRKNVKVGDIIEELKYETYGWYNFPGALWKVVEVNRDDEYCRVVPYNDIAKAGMQELIDDNEAESSEDGFEISLDTSEWDGQFRIVNKTQKPKLPKGPSMNEIKSRLVDLLYQCGIDLDKFDEDYSSHEYFIRAVEYLDDLISEIYKQ